MSLIEQLAEQLSEITLLQVIYTSEGETYLPLSLQEIPKGALSAVMVGITSVFQNMAEYPNCEYRWGYIRDPDNIIGSHVTFIVTSRQRAEELLES